MKRASELNVKEQLMLVCTKLETPKSYQTSCYIPLGSRASHCRSCQSACSVCSHLDKLNPLAHTKGERSLHNQTQYSFVQCDTPSQLMHNLILLHHPNLTHQWISSLHLSLIKVSFALLSLSMLLSSPVPFPLTSSAKRNTPCHALQDFYLADALPHQ